MKTLMLVLAYLVCSIAANAQIPCLKKNEFIVAGMNLSVSTYSTNPKKEVWLKDAWEGTYENGVWKPIVLHNGDEAGFLRSCDPVYRIGKYRAYPSEPAIFHFKTVPYDC